jgi:hypothetical protein
MSKYPREGLKGAAPADFHWLSGSWAGRHGEDVVEEYWSPLGADTLMAMLRWQKDDRVFFYELMVIERDGEHLALRIKHFDPGLRGWEEKGEAMECRLVRLRDREAVFLESNEPRRWVIYRLETDDRLVSYFEADDQPIDPKDLFVYSRRAS